MKLFTSQTWRLGLGGLMVILLTIGISQINTQWLQGSLVIDESNVPSDTRLVYIPEVIADIDDTPVFNVKIRTDEAISGFSLKIHDFPEVLDGMFDIELHSNLTSSYFSQFKSPAGIQYDAASNTYTIEDVYLDMTYPVQIAENQTIEIATITFNTPVTTAHVGTHPFKIELLSSGSINEVQDIYGTDLSFNTYDGNLTISPPPHISRVQTVLIKEYNQSTEKLTFQWKVPTDNPSEYVLIAKKISDHGPEVFTERGGGNTPSDFILRVNDSNPILKSNLTTIIENTNTPDTQNINAGDSVETIVDLYSWLPTGEDANDYFYTIVARELTTEAAQSDMAYRPGDVATAAPSGINAVDYANIFISAPSQFYPDYLITSVDAQVTANYSQVGFIYNDSIIFNIIAADTIDSEAPGQNAIEKASPFISPGSAIPDGQVTFVDALQIINQVQIGAFAKVTDISYLLLESVE